MRLAAAVWIAAIAAVAAAVVAEVQQYSDPKADYQFAAVARLRPGEA